jgi:adenylate kinase
MYNLILFGPPGSGKGTQSARLADRYRLCHLSTGDMLRREIAEGTELGKKTKTMLDTGILVPDEIVIAMIDNQVKLNKTLFAGFIFDGFPRTTAQAIALDDMLTHHNARIDQVISLKVTYDELFKRIAVRSKDSMRSDDTDKGIIKVRISEYKSKSKPVLDYYKMKRKYYFVRGMGTVDEIFGKLCTVVDDYRK